MITGETVRVLAPFNETYPDEYTITEVLTYPDGQVAYVLGDIGAFDAKYLEVVWPSQPETN